MWNLGSGFAQGIYENHRGLDEKREYEELSQQRELARQRTKQIMDKDNIEIETLKYQLEKVKMDNLKMAAGNEKLKLSERFAAITDAVANNRGKFRTDTQEEIDGNNLPENFDKTKYTYDPTTNKYRGVKTEYTTPKDVEQAVTQFKRDVTIDPDGSRWINGIMGNAPDNPVIDVTYNPAKEEMVFLTKDGQERHMQLDMVAYGLGFDKQMTLAQVNRMNEDMARSKTLYELDKIKSEAFKNNAAAAKDIEESKYVGMDAHSRAINANANAMDAQANLYKATHPENRMTQFDKKQAAAQEFNNKLVEMAKLPDDKFYEAAQNDLDVYNKAIMPKGTDRTNVSEAMTAANIVAGMKEFKLEATALMQAKDSETITPTVQALIAKYVPGFVPEEWNDRAKRAAYLDNAAKQLAAKQIKLLSGAAFTQEEFKNQVKAYEAGLTEFANTGVWNSSIDSLIDQWEHNLGTLTKKLNGYQSKFVKGAIDVGNKDRNAMVASTKYAAMENYLDRLSKKSEDEQRKALQAMDPEDRELAFRIYNNRSAE
jgi:hypothetical protein